MFDEIRWHNTGLAKVTAVKLDVIVNCISRGENCHFSLEMLGKKGFNRLIT